MVEWPTMDMHLNTKPGKNTILDFKKRQQETTSGKNNLKPADDYCKTVGFSKHILQK